MSDLHLEVGQQYADFNFPAKAPYLILAGDIGRLKDSELYIDFLRRQCTSFIKVFLVLGNHEFLGTSRAQGLEMCQILEQDPVCHGKLHVLNQSRLDLDHLNVSVLGCTLHSRIPSGSQLMVQMKVSDFQHIENWTVDDHNTEHQRDVDWLKREIQEIRKTTPSRKIVVITHHAPTINGTSKPKDIGSPWSSAFATELLQEDHFADVDCWIFGHTHFSTEFKKGGVRLVSNQRGYVLNGVSLQGQALTSKQQSFVRRYLGVGAKPENIFDVGKVIAV